MTPNLVLQSDTWITLDVGGRDVLLYKLLYRPDRSMASAFLSHVLARWMLPSGDGENDRQVFQRATVDLHTSSQFGQELRPKSVP
jgi:hypothetical protein